MGKTRETSDLVSDNLFSTDISNDRVGIGSTQPTSKVDVNGTVTATAFSGDGSGLTGVANTGNINSDTIDTGSLNVTGITTLAGNTNISGNITSNVTLVSTDTGSSASPELTLYRNSASPAPGDYLGQIMFKGENSNGGEENYAKITGKISDETLGTEDGLIETAIKGDGSFTIVSRQRSDELQLLNGVGLSVDGDSTFTGGIDVDGHTELDNVNVSGVVTTSKLHVDPVGSGITYTEDLVVQGNARVTGILSIGTSSIILDSNTGVIRGINEISIGSSDSNDSPVFIKQKNGKIQFKKTRKHNNQDVETDEEMSVGIGSTASINTSGIITATSFHGNGSNLTGLTHSQVSGAMGDLVDDTTPQLGGNLDLNSNDITGTGDINITGDISATTVSIAGTLTYEDVTNVDSVGVITARSGVNVTGNITVTGTVDGRDIASDGTKLDGIEAGATADQTASEILTAIKTVDGTGSGLDADTLDGVQGSSFLRSDATDTFTGTITGSTLLLGGSQITTSQASLQVNGFMRTGDIYLHEGGSSPTTTSKKLRNNAGELEWVIYKVWNAGNDGSGSGLDADTLDGVQGSSFLRSDAIDTFNASYLEFGGTAVTASEGGEIRLTSPSGQSNGDTVIDMNGVNLRFFYANSPFKGAYLPLTSLADSVASRILTTSDEGSGNGLDADTLDGIQGSSFLRSDISDAMFGTLTLHSGGTNTYGWLKGYPNNNHFITIRADITGSTSSPTVSAGHYHNYVEYLNTDSSGFYFKRSDTGTYTDVAKITRTGIYFGSNTVWHAGNDGSGSGLDADTLDGTQLSNISTTNSTEYSSGNFDSFTSNGFHKINNIGSGFTNQPTGAYQWGSLRVTQYSGSNYVTQEYIPHNSGGPWIRQKWNGTWTAWREVWSSDADGSGSGLDADTLDGVNSGSFLRSDTNETYSTGTFTFGSGTLLDLATNDVYASLRVVRNSKTTSPYNDGMYIGYGNGNNGATRIYGGGSITTHLALGSSTITFGGNTVWHAGNDGSGSGLDADTVDGIQASAFVTETEITNHSINPKFSSTIGFGNDSAVLYYNDGTNTTRTDYWTNKDAFEIRGDGNSRTNVVLKTGNLDIDDNAYIGGRLGLEGNLYLTGTVTTTNQGRLIDFTGFDKEGTTDFSDRAYIQHTVNTGGHGGSVLVISSQNDSNDGIAFLTNGSSQLKHNSNTVWDAGNDGSGSGLDADTIDGTQLSNLMTLSGAQTATGAKTFSNGNGAGAIFTSSSYSDFLYIGGWSTTNSNNIHRIRTSTNLHIDSSSDSSILMQWYSGRETQYNGHVRMRDNKNIYFGTGADFRMHFNGADMYFRNYAHANGDIIFQGENSSGTNQNLAIMKCDGTRNYVILYENNSERFRTTSGGVTVTGALTATGDVTAFSDITLKEDIEVIPNALDKVSQIRGVTFTRKDLDDKSRKSGVIAQEVEKVLPEVVSTTEDGTKTVAYGNLVGLLIESIKELKAEVEELKKERN